MIQHMLDNFKEMGLKKESEFIIILTAIFILVRGAKMLLMGMVFIFLQ